MTAGFGRLTSHYSSIGLGVAMKVRKGLLLAGWVLVSLGLPNSPKELILATLCVVMIYIGLQFSIKLRLSN